MNPRLSILKGYFFAAFFLLLLNSTSTSAQIDTRSLFSVTGGYSLPVGEMAIEKLDDPLAGLAGAGYFGQANYDLRVFRWLGLRLSGSLNVNKTNSGPIIDKANTYAQTINRRFAWEDQVSQWKLAAGMIGPALYVTIGRAQIEAHVQGGMVHATTPSVLLTGTEIDGTGKVIENSEKITVSLDHAVVKPYAAGAGLSLRYALSRTLYFQLGGDVIGAQAEVKNLAIKAKAGSYEFSDQINEKRFIGVVNIGVGLGFAF